MNQNPHRQQVTTYHVLQNLAEARYLVSLYQYLRLRGHPADKISVLTTYNGQKALLREEIEHRCAGSDFARAMFGRPLKVSQRLYKEWRE